MSTNKKIDIICVVVLILAIILTVLFMNGEKLGLTVVVDEDAETTTASSYFTTNDMDGDWDTSEATIITLEGEDITVSGSGAYVNDGSVYITQSGYYLVSGELTDGSIVVSAEDNSKIWIMLDGVDIYCSDDAGIIVEQADKVFLTLAYGSENTIETGSEYSEEAVEDDRDGAIFSHDDLTINGSGSLTVTTSYSHGIVSKDDLIITGGTITVTAPADGLKANDALNITDADITIDVEDDGISCDDSIYIGGGTILISNSYEGIEAVIIEIEDGDITIYSTDDGINANGGSTEEFGMGQMESSTTTDSETTEETYISISGGTLRIFNEGGNDADGIDSNGDIRISGGTIFISLTDGGSNNAIDYASENGGVAVITGGTIIAAGSSGMAESFDSTSTQASILYTTSASMEAGTTVSVVDADGNEILSWEVPYSFSSINISSPDLVIGETYTITAGDESETVTLEDVVTTAGEATAGGMGQMGGMGQGGRGGMGMAGGQAGFESEETTESEDSTDTAQSLSELDSQTWILLGVSAAVLVAGLGFAIFYRKGRL